MADTVSVRFDDETRERLEFESAARGVGISTFVRQLAETELKRIREERIRIEARAVTTYLSDHPTAFDDDEPSAWAIVPVQVTLEILAGLVGSRVRVSYEHGVDQTDVSKSSARTGILKRVPAQGNRFAIGRHLISIDDVKDVRRLD